MPQRPMLALAASVILTLLFLVRYHLRDGAETVLNDATFYPHLQQHPKLLYRYPGDSTQGAEKDEHELVPSIIHRILLPERQEASDSKNDVAITSCQNLHPNWTHQLWTDESATALITEYYPSLLPQYLSYRQSTQRAKLLRYALLDHYGGVYLDRDVICLQPLDELRTLPWLTLAAYPAGVDNSFIVSRPKHVLLRNLLYGLESRSSAWRIPYLGDWSSAGRAYFSNTWMSYARSLARRPAQEICPEERVYVLADREGNLGNHMLRGGVSTPLLRRQGASNWYGWDATTIVMIGQHYKYFLATMGLGAICTMTWLIRVSRRRKWSRSWLDVSSRSRSLEKAHDTEAGCIEKSKM